MNFKITFSDASYQYKHSLKISNHLVKICVFYRQNALNFWSFFPIQRVYLVIGSYVLDEITLNSAQMCRRIG